MGQRRAYLGLRFPYVKYFFVTVGIDVFAWPFKGLPVRWLNMEKALFQ